MVKVEDNFLEDKDFQAIKNTLLKDDFFDWYFNHEIVNDHPKDNLHFFQFTHFLYRNHVRSQFFNICTPILKKLDVKSLVRIKVNLSTFSTKLVEGGFHRDYDFDCKSALFYVNTNNGYTKFKKNNKIIKSVENRMALFKATELHTGTNTTDQKCRVAINFAYF